MWEIIQPLFIPLENYISKEKADLKDIEFKKYVVVTISSIITLAIIGYNVIITLKRKGEIKDLKKEVQEIKGKMIRDKNK